MDTSSGECILRLPKHVAEEEEWTFRSVRFGYRFSSGKELSLFVLSVPEFVDYDAPVQAAPPVITTASLPDGRTGTPYSHSLTASSDTPVTWSLSGDTLPDGLTLSADGTLSGTPAEGGVFTFTVVAANSAGSTLSAFTLTVNFSPVIAPTITTEALTDGLTNAPYGFQFEATGTKPFTWSADTLPDGLSLNAEGFLSGTPASAGSYSFTVHAENSEGVDSQDLSLAITEAQAGKAPSITTASLGSAATGQHYALQLMASGTPPFTWSVKGKLPEGLSLSSSGLLTGTPAKKGKKNITFIAENAEGDTKKKLTLQIYEPPEITTETLNEATVGKKYSMALKPKGTKPFTWTFEGTLPEGLTFDGKKGKITGTPTDNTEGVIRVTLSNEEGETTKVFTLTVKATPPTISTKKLKDGKYGKSYSVKLKAKGTEPITFALSGTLPAGLSFDAETGTLTGTPTAACTDLPITITASNMGGTDTKNYTLTIKGIAPKITTKSLPNGAVGVMYSQDIAVTGTPEITWSATGLPSGLSINSTYGTILGTPAEAGTFKVTITATNSVKTAKKKLKLTVSAGQTRTASRSTSALNTEALTRETVRKDYTVVAELGTVSVDKAGMYDFTAVLSPEAGVGEELVYLARSSEPSEDDDIAEFSDEAGEETEGVPESRRVTVSVWLNPGRVYFPAIAVAK